MCRRVPECWSERHPEYPLRRLLHHKSSSVASGSRLPAHSRRRVAWDRNPDHTRKPAVAGPRWPCCSLPVLHRRYCGPVFCRARPCRCCAHPAPRGRRPMTCRTPISGKGRESRTGYSGTIEPRRARHVSCCVHQDTLLQKPEQESHVFSQSQDNSYLDRFQRFFHITSVPTF